MRFVRRYNFYIIPLLCLSFARPYLFILSHSYVHGVMHVCAAIVSSLLMLILDPLHLLHESSILFMFHFLLHYLHFLLSTRGFHCNSRESIYLIFSPDLLPLRDTLGHLPCPSAHARCHIQFCLSIFHTSMKPNLYIFFIYQLARSYQKYFPI